MIQCFRFNFVYATHKFIGILLHVVEFTVRVLVFPEVAVQVRVSNQRRGMSLWVVVVLATREGRVISSGVHIVCGV